MACITMFRMAGLAALSGLPPRASVGAMLNAISNSPPSDDALIASKVSSNRVAFSQFARGKRREPVATFVFSTVSRGKEAFHAE